MDDRLASTGTDLSHSPSEGSPAPWIDEYESMTLDVTQVASAVAEVLNPKGLHMWPCQSIHRCTSGFDSEIFIQNLDSEGQPTGERRSAHQLMDICQLQSEMGGRLLIQAEGADAELAVTTLKELFVRKFDEE